VAIKKSSGGYEAKFGLRCSVGHGYELRFVRIRFW
jgi:hypothetical protein